MFAYKNMKTKEKTSRVIPKVVGVAYMRAASYESFYYKFKSQFKWFSKRWLQQERVA